MPSSDSITILSHSGSARDDKLLLAGNDRDSSVNLQSELLSDSFCNVPLPVSFGPGITEEKTVANNATQVSENIIHTFYHFCPT